MTRRRQLLWWSVGLLLVAGLLGFWFGLVEPSRVHWRWYHRVDSDLKSLVHKRPAGGVTKGQWEYVVGWTGNLHANCGADTWSFDRKWGEEFAAELERRLAGPITLADVDWIWDEYLHHAHGAKRYNEYYRPTSGEGFLEAQPGCFGIPVD